MKNLTHLELYKRDPKIARLPLNKPLFQASLYYLLG